MLRQILILAFILSISCKVNITKLKFKRSLLNELKPSNIIETLIDVYTAVPVSIGTPSQEFNLNLKLSKRHSYVIAKEANYTLPSFDKSKSSSFVQVEPEQTYYQDIYKGIKAKETFHFGDIELGGATFFIETEKNYMPSPLLNSGTFGLSVNEGQYPSLAEANFIKQLKKNDKIDSYAFTIKYSEDKKDEGELIIGALPHLYDSSYEADNLLTANTMNAQYFLEWGLIFNNITYNGTDLGKNVREAVFRVESGVIWGNMEYFYIIHEQFFKKYIDLKLCNQVKTTNYYYYHCDKNGVNYTEMVPISFYSKELNYTFNLTHEDLFYELEDRKYFLVLFYTDYRSLIYWILGEPFLRKFQIVFDQDKKLIGIYKPSKGSGGLGYWWILIVASVIIACLLAYIVIFVLKKPRKKRALELDDDYEYVPN